MDIGYHRVRISEDRSKKATGFLNGYLWVSCKSRVSTEKNQLLSRRCMNMSVSFAGKKKEIYQTLISFHPGCKKKHGSLRIYPNTIQESYMTLVQHNRILYGIMWYPKCKWPTNRIHFHPRWTPDCCKMSTFPTGKIHPLSTKPPTGSHCASRDTKSKVTSFNSTSESNR